MQALLGLHVVCGCIHIFKADALTDPWRKLLRAEEDPSSAVMANLANHASDPKQETAVREDTNMGNSTNPSLCRSASACDDELGFLTRLSVGNGFAECYRSKIEEAFADRTAEVIALVSTHHVICILNNWLVQAQSALERDVPIVHFALDHQVHSFCINATATLGNSRLTCVDLSGWLPDVNEGGAAIKLPEFGSCIYQMITWSKPLILMHAAKASKHGVLMIDSDVIVLGPLMTWFKNFKSPVGANDTLLITGSEAGDGFNTGTVFATRSSLPLLQEWLSIAPSTWKVRKAGDQSGFATLMTNRFIDKLPLAAKVPTSVVGECAKRGSLAMHFNCVDKISSMKGAGLWAPNPSWASCAS